MIWRCSEPNLNWNLLSGKVKGTGSFNSLTQAEEFLEKLIGTVSTDSTADISYQSNHIVDLDFQPSDVAPSSHEALDTSIIDSKAGKNHCWKHFDLKFMPFSKYTLKGTRRKLMS